MRTALLVATGAALLGALLSAQAPLSTSPRITQAEFKQLLKSGGVTILDTRNADVYRIGHIPGAILLPLEGLPDFPPQYSRVIAELKSVKQPIVAYCA